MSSVNPGVNQDPGNTQNQYVTATDSTGTPGKPVLVKGPDGNFQWSTATGTSTASTVTSIGGNNPATMLWEDIASGNPSLQQPGGGASLSGVESLNFFTGSFYAAMVIVAQAIMKAEQQLQDADRKFEVNGQLNGIQMALSEAQAGYTADMQEANKDITNAVTSGSQAAFSGIALGAMAHGPGKAAQESMDKETKPLSDENAKLTQQNKQYEVQKGKLDEGGEAHASPGEEPQRKDFGEGAEGQAVYDKEHKNWATNKGEIEKNVKTYNELQDKIDANNTTITQNTAKIESIQQGYKQQFNQHVQTVLQMTTQLTTMAQNIANYPLDVVKAQQNELRTLFQSWLQTYRTAAESAHQSGQSATQEWQSWCQFMQKLAQYTSSAGGKGVSQ